MSAGVVPLRDIIYFLSDIFLGVWRFIFSLAIYFRGQNHTIHCVKSPRGSPEYILQRHNELCMHNILPKKLGEMCDICRCGLF